MYTVKGTSFTSDKGTNHEAIYFVQLSSVALQSERKEIVQIKKVGILNKGCNFRQQSLEIAALEYPHQQAFGIFFVVYALQSQSSR